MYFIVSVAQDFQSFVKPLQKNGPDPFIAP